MSTRDRILDAAAEVIQTLGLAKATTREIARSAGFSEATIYKHFSSKEELFMRVIMERMPTFVSLMKQLSTLAGQNTVRENLSQVATAALDFYGHSMPLGSSLFSDPDLLGALQTELKKHGAGPHRANGAVAGYLLAEQQLGRVRANLDCEATAYLLLGACFQRSYWSRFLGEDIIDTAGEPFITGLIQSLMNGIEP